MIRTLIVDDEFLIRYAIRNAVDWNSLGYQIISEAENGDEALTKIKELKPDLVLLDLNLPLMNGIEVCRQIREQHLDTAIIVLTGYNDFKSIQQCLRFGVIDYVVKPIEAIELSEALEKAKQLLESAGDLSRDLLSQNFYPETASTQSVSNVSLHLNQVHLQNYLLKMQYPEFMQYIDRQLSQAIAVQISKERFILLCAVIINTLLDFSASLNIHPEKELKDQLSISSYLDNYETAARMKQALLESCRQYIDTHLQKCQRNPLIKEVIDYVQLHYADYSLSSGSVARNLSISSNYLSKLFRQEFGITITEYITQIRISEAVAILETNDSISITDLAHLVGYSDSFYFSKIFRKQKGTSPSEYARIIRQVKK